MPRSNVISIGIIICVILLTVFGLIELFGITYRLNKINAFYKQLVALGWGCCVGLIIYWLPYYLFKRLSIIWGLIGVLLLILVLVIGVSINGATRWIRINGIQFQPIDWAKIGLVLTLAYYTSLSGVNMTKFISGFIIPLAIIGIHVVLIFVQPDWGGAAILGTTGIGLMYISGARLRFILPMMFCITLVFIYCLSNDINRFNRVLAFIYPNKFLDTVNYQTYQAQLAIESGGLTGLGLGKSQRVNLLPECEHDFIFAVIVEEWGIIIASMLIMLYFMLFMLIFKLGSLVTDRFSRLVIYGLGLILLLQTIINLFVVTGMAPNKGVPLPFMSLGGSNCMMTIVMIAIILKLAYNKISSKTGTINS